MRTLKALLFVLLLARLSGAPALAAESDGPYVMRNAAGKLEAWSIETTPQGASKRITPLEDGATISIAAVGAVPPFTVTLRPEEKVAPDSVTTKNNTALFVVADTHGEYEILAQMLMSQHVVDRALRWNFGRGHLVVLGDVFDRGPNQTEILWLLYALEAQARKAGGGMDFVLGNHEVMSMRGDLRYLNPRYRESAALLGVDSYSALFSARSVLGQWLRTKPAVLKLNDLLCLHGGISPELVQRKLAPADINSTIRTLLGDSVFDTDAARERAVFLLGETGPLWYRGYFPAESGIPAPTMDDIDRIRAHFGVSRILVGHTRVPTITPLYDGKVIAVQVYPRRDPDGRVQFEALRIRGAQLQRARPDGGTEPLIP
jgi:hypothetical protein